MTMPTDTLFFGKIEKIWFVENPWFYEILGPAAILLSAIGAWIFAILSIRSARNISTKKSTFDYISKLSWDEDYIRAKETFMQVRLGPKKLRSVSEEYERLKDQGNGNGDGTEITNETIKHHSAIKNILNEYEALAIAIKSGALDSEMIRKNIHQQLVEHVNSCNEFIEHTRKTSGAAKPDRIWCEAQELAKKWEKLLK